jgi:putative transposase
MKKISYSGYRFPPAIIQQAIWLYLRFTLGLRDVEDLLAERGITVSYESIRRWISHFGPMIAADLRKRRPKPHTSWRLDEVYLKIDGNVVYLWRAVDAEGEVLDVLVQSKRNQRAAMKLMRKLLKKYGFVPDRLITDDLRSYGAAARDLGIEKHHERGRWKNNRAENSHQPTRRRERKMQGFKSPRISPTISFNSCSRLQHLQRPTPSDLSVDAPWLSRHGDGDLACGGRLSTYGAQPFLRSSFSNVTRPARMIGCLEMFGRLREANDQPGNSLSP